MVDAQISNRNYVLEWKLTLDELEDMVSQAPSLRGVLMGYLAEYRLQKQWLTDSRLSRVVKFDEHNRKVNKADFMFTYRGNDIRLQVKSLQTNQVRHENSNWIGKFQCDASDKRRVEFPDGSFVDTTCLLIGDFDVVAVNLFEFGREWNFAFACNQELPRSRYKKYTEYQRGFLLSSLMPISFPVEPPYSLNLFETLDRAIQNK